MFEKPLPPKTCLLGLKGGIKKKQWFELLLASGSLVDSPSPIRMINCIKHCLIGLAVCLATLCAAAEELVLEEAIHAALEENLGLRIATYAPANAQDAIEIEAAQFDFELFGSASLRDRQAAAGGRLDDAPAPETGNRNAQVGIQKLFSTGATATVDSSLNRSSTSNDAPRNPDYGSDVGFSLRQPLLRDAGSTVNLAPLARAKVSADRSLFQLRSEILDLVAETEIAYWNLAFARADRELIGSSLELAENLLEENRERQRLGLVTPLEVLQAEAEVLDQQEAIILADRVIENAEDSLRRAIGEANFVEPLSGSLVVAELPAEPAPLRPLSDVVQDTILSDVDAKAQERQIEVERINLLLAEDDTQTDLDLVAGLSYLGRDESGSEAYRGAYSADGYDWNVGMEVRLPWGFRESRAKVRQAERDLERSQLELYDIKQDKALSARIAWRSASSGLKRIEVTRAALGINLEAFEQERARYGSGLVAYRSVLEAQRDLDRAKSNYLDAIIETVRASVRLSRVDGTILARNGLDWNTVQPYTQVSTPSSEKINPVAPLTP